MLGMLGWRQRSQPPSQAMSVPLETGAQPLHSQVAATAGRQNVGLLHATPPHTHTNCGRDSDKCFLPVFFREEMMCRFCSGSLPDW